jgi:hypothetical protein
LDTTLESGLADGKVVVIVTRSVTEVEVRMVTIVVDDNDDDDDVEFQYGESARRGAN